MGKLAFDKAGDQDLLDKAGDQDLLDKAGDQDLVSCNQYAYKIMTLNMKVAWFFFSHAAT